ncbi:MAG: hypothetical protein IJO06_00470 [Thermoguttaceae bacterium]|nr:hypothetical protein [Thermoguttaceae bacterium]
MSDDGAPRKVALEENGKKRIISLAELRKAAANASISSDAKVWMDGRAYPWAEAKKMLSLAAAEDANVSPSKTNGPNAAVSTSDDGAPRKVVLEENGKKRIIPLEELRKSAVSASISPDAKIWMDGRAYPWAEAKKMLSLAAAEDANVSPSKTNGPNVAVPWPSQAIENAKKKASVDAKKRKTLLWGGVGASAFLLVLLVASALLVVGSGKKKGSETRETSRTEQNAAEANRASEVDASIATSEKSEDGDAGSTDKAGKDSENGPSEQTLGAETSNETDKTNEENGKAREAEDAGEQNFALDLFEPETTEGAPNYPGHDDGETGEIFGKSDVSEEPSLDSEFASEENVSSGAFETNVEEPQIEYESGIEREEIWRNLDAMQNLKGRASED